MQNRQDLELSKYSAIYYFKNFHLGRWKTLFRQIIAVQKISENLVKMKRGKIVASMQISLEFYGKTKDSQNFLKNFAPLHFHKIFVFQLMKIETQIGVHE